MEQSILLLLLRVCAFERRRRRREKKRRREEKKRERERERERDFSHRDLIKERESFIIKQIGEEDGDVRRGRRE